MLYNYSWPKEIILYKKSFPIEKGMTISRYIKAVNEESFTPYILNIEKISSADSYLLETIFVDSAYMLQPGYKLAAMIFRPIMLNKGVLEYSISSNLITLKAYADLKRLFPSIITIILLLVFLLYTIIITGELYIIVMLVFILLIPFGIYRRDVNRYKAIGKLALKTTNKNKGK